MRYFSSLFVCIFLLSCEAPAPVDGWQLGPFTKHENNPILLPQGDTWESKDLFNPTAWTDGETIYLFYRAEDSTGIGIWNGTSRIGLARSTDGINFDRDPDPMFEPSEEWELPGGTEDPRITKVGDTFYLTYTAYDGKRARLGLATSESFSNWEKHGPIFPDIEWTKSGAILDTPINGKYWMYFGDTDVWAAHSEDLLNWTWIEEPVLPRRPGQFDSRVVEPGPQPMMTDEGILLLYNGADDDLVYKSGQALFDPNDPTKLLKRSDTPFLEPNTLLEQEGQIANVVFIEGLVKFKGTWFLYFGMGDSGIGVASMSAE
ncbi:MAG: glycoside hydrolase family 130 protein [Rhodothermales bacterium]